MIVYSPIQSPFLCVANGLFLKRLQIGNKYFLFECTMKADQSLFSGVMTDIRDNVAVGRTVTVHEKMIHLLFFLQLS